jgi:hypothetical protein
MSASEVSICSNALLMLGAQPINDLTENSDRARLASNLFPAVRDYVLRRHPWNCAVKRVLLAPDVERPVFDWTYQFTLPPDYMRTLSVGYAGCEDDFKIESGKLLCDANPCLLRYVWRNTNPATWDDMLVWGMTVSMKAVMAYPITQSTSLAQVIEAALKDVLRQARAVDGQDETPDELGNSPLLAARMGGRGGGRWGPYAVASSPAPAPAPSSSTYVDADYVLDDYVS